MLSVWRDTLRPLLAGRLVRTGWLVLLLLVVAVAEGFSFSLVLPLLAGMTGIAPVGGGLVQALLDGLAVVAPPDRELETVLAVLLVAFSIRFGLALWAVYATRRFAMDLRRQWARDVLDHVLHSPMADLGDRRGGALVSLIQTESQRAATALVLLMDSIGRTLQIAALAAVMLATSWQATLGLVAGTAALYLLIRGATGRASWRIGRQRLVLEQDIASIAAESFSALRTVKVFGLQDRQQGLLDSRMARFVEVEPRFKVLSEAPFHATDLLAAITLVVSLLVLVHLANVDLAAAIPTIAMFGVMAARMISGATFVLARRMKIVAALPSLGALRDLGHAGAREALDTGIAFDRLDGDVVVDGVAFSHPGRPAVFSGLHLTIPLHATTAITGPSGSGKSTLVDLLVGLHRPAAGRILLGSVPLDAVRLADWRRRVAYVTQDADIFHGTIAENVRLGRQEADDDAVSRALEAAGLRETVAALPEGADTVVGDRGLALSGGQKQRLAIARALVRDPDLFIFDEATSALDPATAAGIHRTIARLAGRATVVIIAHRLDAIDHADRIYRLSADGTAVADIQPATSAAQARTG